MRNEEPAQSQEDGSPGVVSRELVEKFLSVSEEGTLSERDKERFIAMAVTYQLNPFKRELHAKVSEENGIKRVDLIVGYEVYIKKAERTGLLDGWKSWIEGSGETLKAVVEIQRKDWKNPFVHEVYWSEAVQRRPDGTVFDFWERMPRFQLKKVAISQGFRLCFSDEIGGMPYDGAELPLQETSPSVAGKQPPIPAGSLLSTAKPTPVSQPTHSGGNLATEIHERAMASKDLLSSQHLEWIENQLRMEKSEAQLRGLMKHLEETIAAGGDDKEPKARTRAKPSYPRTEGSSRRPRIPSSYQRPAQPQEVPIF